MSKSTDAYSCPVQGSGKEVLRPVPKQPCGISLSKGTVPIKGTTTPSTPAGLLLFSRARRQPTSFTGSEANLLVQTPVWFC
ncbi:hypothetical protein Taro_035048 [Colocasia esculenta]|uniref:Uncharacterized protein n=1 Tax=Colocasia esculenta TaxID=4460 RepID=A0A843WC13_COLES|nr:hypothetical protein [Colocasia esculenta]